MTTDDTVRVPEDAFNGLPGFGFLPHYAELDGMRIAYLDEGPIDGPPVWFMHGEPTWSYLWRKVFPAVAAAGYRCIVPDLAGFGRSDKPTDVGWYSYDRHAGLMGALAEHLDLTGGTMVVHDWGGPIGMRLFVQQPERFERLVVLDTGLFTGEQPMTDAWRAFRDFVSRTEDLPIGFLVKGACARGLEDDVAAAYEAPFPSVASKAGARAFPLMLPTSPQMDGAAAGRAVRDALAADHRPKLVLWADADPIIPVKAGVRLAELINAPPPELIQNASHFLQEDAGAQIGARIAQWLGAPTPSAA
ncbi:MAG: alpha/beta fold hydrolase [Solirubrobacterales bacterium]|nr:alpha/beta fold hydrolase [Solirubrobacterales bacterium]